MLSRKQRRALVKLHVNGFVNYYIFPYGGRNKPLWTLLDMGLAEFGFGPKDCWLQTQGFIPLWQDPVC